MNSDEELEKIAYFAAIENVLADQKRDGISKHDESDLVIAMHESGRHFLDCVEALLVFRQGGKVDSVSPHSPSRTD